MIFNLGAPSQIDTLGHEARRARPRFAGRSSRSRPTSPDIQISEIFPAAREDRRQVLAGAQLLSHGRGGARHRPSDDADRPAVHRRHQHAARRLRAGVTCKGREDELPAHVVLPEPMGPTGGNMPHGQDAGFLGKAYDPFVLNADPSKPRFQSARPAAARRRSARSRLERRREAARDRR